MYASLFLYDFSGPPGGHPDGGKAHLRVAPRGTLPLLVLRLLYCAVGARSTKYFLKGPGTERSVAGLKSVTFFWARRFSLLASVVSVVGALRGLGAFCVW